VLAPVMAWEPVLVMAWELVLVMAWELVLASVPVTVKVQEAPA